ncbi:MAG: LCP family protein, partial [Actinobacteria bacterium]|nr:LCP family protein [Actinomycetota bacterium]
IGLIYFLIIGLFSSLTMISISSCSKNGSSGKSTQQQASTSETSAVNTALETTVSSATEEKKNYYVSTSEEFPNYSFICPEGWKLFDSGDGSRILIEDSDVAANKNESIYIIVEPLEKMGELKTDEQIFSSYLADASKEAKTVVFEDEKVNIDGNNVNLTGYEYKSLLNKDENIKNIDYFTFIKKDNFIYAIKYIGQNTETSQAKKTITDFISGFTFDDKVEKLKEKDKSSSMNILILGDDSAFDRPGGRVNGRTDIIIIFHINLDTGKGTAVTVPRDTWVNIPGHGEGKINGAHAIGGNELTIQTIEEFSGLTIDNYIITDFDGFKPLIDFLGGVTVEVGENLSDSFSGCYLTKGIHHLNGEQALALCRNRHRSGDGTTQGGAFAREKEAAKVITSLLEQKSTFERLIALPLLINFLLKYTWTDMEFKDILRLLPVLGKVKTGDIEITGVPSWPQAIGKASAVVYDKEATQELFDQIKNQ